MNRVGMINRLSIYPHKKFTHNGVTISRSGEQLRYRDERGNEGVLDGDLFNVSEEFKEIEIKEPIEQINIVIEDMIKKLERMKVE